jgi:hypothetical protein
MERMIDAATGYVPPSKPVLTEQQKEAALQVGRDVVSNLRCMYPDVLKNAPSTVAIHLRHTIASEVEKLLLSQNKPHQP